MLRKDTVFGIIGLGLIGGTFAKGLHEAGYTVYAVDIDEAAIAYGKSKGWIIKGGSDPSLVQECDIVISALYPDAFLKWITENGRYLKPGSLLSDVSGVKRSVISHVREHLPSGVQYLSCHPMAGREFRGIAYADTERFHGANFLLVSEDDTPADALETMRQVAEILGFGRISTLSAEQHDRMIGFLSQLTHVIAVALMNASSDPDLVRYTGDSFRDLTRIALINEELWPQLFLLNKDILLEEIDGFVKEMMEFRTLLENDDTAGMQEKMRISGMRRKEFDKR